MSRKNVIAVIIFFLSFSLDLFGNENGELTIVFTGDVLLDRGVRKQIKKKGIEKVFQKVKPFFKKSDFTVINLECPVTSSNTPIMKEYVFRAEPYWLPALKDAGITHCVLANNHSNDQSRSGLVETAENLKNNSLIPVGFGSNQQEACEPIIIQKNGFEVAIFSSVLLPLENWMYLPDKPGPCQATPKQLADSIKKYKKNKPDSKIIVVLHWGIEFHSEPNEMQRKIANQLISAGADAVIGHHPHVVQKMEMIDGKPVFYSLGNFVFDQSKEKAKQAMIVKFTVNKNGFFFKEYDIFIKNCFPEIKN